MYTLSRDRDECFYVVVVVVASAVQAFRKCTHFMINCSLNVFFLSLPVCVCAIERLYTLIVSKQILAQNINRLI